MRPVCVTSQQACPEGGRGEEREGCRVSPATGPEYRQRVENERHPPAYSGLPIRTTPKKSARHDCHQTWHWGRLVPVSRKVFNRDYHPSEGCEYGSVPDPAASDWANQSELTVGLSREQTHNRHFGWLPFVGKIKRACFVYAGRGASPAAGWPPGYPSAASTMPSPDEDEDDGNDDEANDEPRMLPPSNKRKKV